MYEEFTELTEQEAKDYIKASEQQTVRKIIAHRFHAANLKPKQILEIGCARGIDAKYYSPEEYTGVDISEPLIKQARLENKDYKFIVDNAESLTIPSKSFTHVYFKSFFEHLPSEEVLIKCLKEGLRICSDTMYIAWHTPPLPQIEKTIINKVKGHFGKIVYQNNYPLSLFANLLKTCKESGCTQIENFYLWEINL
jgi:ubiquinone/menaquinone biosynthesis C-methylase UbiE